MELIDKILGTIILRWYVVLFLTGYLIVAVPHLGWKRMSCFSLIGFIVGFLSDYNSTHNGFPFGMYHYTHLTINREIFIDNVPIITGISFVFLTYIGYNVAIFIYSPLFINKKDIQFVSTKKVERSMKVCITGSLIMMLIDVVIDPISLQGKKWFLEDFYWYQEKGEHFGVPVTNYLGWFFVGFVTIYIFQRIDSYLSDMDNSSFSGQRHIPYFGIAGLLFYCSILAFMLFIAASIGEIEIIASSVITFIPFLVLIASLLFKESNRATFEDFTAHAKDYPYSPLLKKIPQRR